MITGVKILSNIRKNTTYLRKKVKKKSLEEMSSDIKISKDTLYRLENDLTREIPLYPNLKTIIALVDYFGVDIGDFLSKDLEQQILERLETIDKLERLDTMETSLFGEDNIKEI